MAGARDAARRFASLRFCARALEADAGYEGCFLAPASARLRGRLESARTPSDFQRHEVGPGGAVLHLEALGIGPAAPGSAPAAAPARGPAPGPAPGPARRARRGAADAARRGAPAEPWAAVLYASGRRPEAARRQLAAALGLPHRVLRAGPVMQAPGTSVQMVSLARGLPAALPAGALADALRGGVLPGRDPLVAVGDVSLAGPGGAWPAGPQASTASRRRVLREAWRCEGHRYTVVLRGLDRRQCDGGAVDECVQRLADDGFVNLFDLASFGLAEVRRYEVGAALWAGQWDLAARLLLTLNRGGDGSPWDGPTAAFNSGDFERGLELLPAEGAEGPRGLATQLLLGRPALEAMQKAVPESVWKRHMTAVSRLAWNHAVARRFAEKPARPLAGDLVWDAAAGEARPLKANEVDAWRLSDVVLPLPRPGEHVPECASRLHLESVLRRLVPGQDAAVSDLPFSTQRFMPAVRRVVGAPCDVSWDLLEAADSGPLVDCDLRRLGVDPLQGAAESPAAPRRAGGRAGGRRSRGGGPAAGRDAGPALRVRFSLPLGDSAEGALRELMRANPSDFAAGLGRQDETF